MNYQSKNYQREFAKLMQQAQRDIMYAAIDAIQERNNQMFKLLENGKEILEQTTREHFVKIYKQRLKLWIKMEENNKSIETIWNILNTKCIKI